MKKPLFHLKRILTLRCADCAKLLSNAQDSRPVFVDRTAIAGHLLVCVWCRRFRRQLAILARLAGFCRMHPNARMQPRLTAATKSRMQRAILRAIQSRGSS